MPSLHPSRRTPCLGRGLAALAAVVWQGRAGRGEWGAAFSYPAAIRGRMGRRAPPDGGPVLPGSSYAALQWAVRWCGAAPRLPGPGRRPANGESSEVPYAAKGTTRGTDRDDMTQYTRFPTDERQHELIETAAT